MFEYIKIIDRSTLRQGFTIPVRLHDDLFSVTGGPICHGDQREIVILLHGVRYNVRLMNQAFSRFRFYSHKDVIQIRYSQNSAFCQKLREVFSASLRYVEEIKALPKNRDRKLNIHIPEIVREFLVLQATSEPLVFRAHCISNVTKIYSEPSDSNAAGSDSVHENELIAMKEAISDIRRQLSDYGHSIDELKQHPVTISINNARFDMQGGTYIENSEHTLNVK